MPTFPSPVSVTSFKEYLRDGTTDTTLLAFYASLLDTATEKIYTFLGRDYTPSASKTDIFFGNGYHVHRMENPSETLTFWKTFDINGILTTQDLSELVIMANGEIVVNSSRTFDRKLEHRIAYSQPAALTCPESVMQVITEVAAIILEESKQGSARLGIMTESDKAGTATERFRYLDLTERQKEMLSPYKRIPV
jgi:hypothetical protein